MKKFDAIIIGSGQSGKPLALALADQGWKVAIIEEKHVGGSCINYGCTPTKAMIASAKVSSLAKKSREFGVITGKVKIDFKKVIQRRDKIVKDFRSGSKKQLQENKNITLIKGTASFSEKKVIKVKMRKEYLTFSAKYIFINTGTVPLTPPIKGINEVDYLTSVSIMNLKKLPEHLIIIGGGYIGLEFAQMYRRLGSKVTVIEAGDFIPKEDTDISSELRKILEDDGIKIYTNAKAKMVSKSRSGNIRVKVSLKNKSETITGYNLLIAAGTKPATDELNLEAAGMKTDEKGFIKVNNKLETNVKNIYAMGDVKGGPAFTHISYDDYRILRENLLNNERCTVKNRMTPYTVFTDPQLAKVGLNEKEAKKNNIDYKVAKMEMKKVARAIETNETEGLMKALVDPKSKKILGCTILGTDGGELMSMIQIAMECGMPYTKLQNMIFAHPLLSESLNNLFGKVEK